MSDLRCISQEDCIYKSTFINPVCYRCEYLTSVLFNSTPGSQIPVSDKDLDEFTDFPDIFDEPCAEPVEQALRYNKGKPQWSLVHYKSLEPMIRVLEFGALKYAPRNWQKPMPLDKILESMQRHLAALMDGEEFDSESGISHMGHIMCNGMFYTYHKDKLNGEVKSEV